MSSPAHAENHEKEDTKVEILARVGYADLFDNRVEPINSLGLGFGTQLGLELRRFVIGARFDYYLGDDYDWEPETLPSDFAVHREARDALLGFVAGYSIGSLVVVRPQICVGATIQRTIEHGVVAEDDTQLALAAYPGLGVFLVRDVLRIGLDMAFPLLAWTRVDTLVGFASTITVGLTVDL